MGGVRMLYRHVDILNQSGFDAAIVHYSPRFHIDWFEHSTRILHMPVRLNDHDIAVFAEVGGLKISGWAPGHRKVIFNQNAYYTFMRYPLEGGVKTPYQHPEVAAAIVVSEDSRKYLQHIFPNLPIHRIRYSIDPTRYFPQQKKRQICFMPRKNPEDAKQVLYILRYRKKLAGWTVQPIDGVSEQRAAEIMRESAIFLSFGHPEGFGLPPAEAMACDTIVIGYDGRGGAEYWPGHAIRIAMGDTLGYSEALERLLEEYDRDPSRLIAMAHDAGRFVRDTYSQQAEANSILECWSAIAA